MATSTVFTLPEFKPYENRFISRVNTFLKFRRYYDGTIYEDSAFRMAHKLYAQTKALVSFLARAVDLDVALVPGVMNPWELKDAPEAQTEAQQLLYEWSSWDTEGDDWLEDGATLGEAMLKIVPDLAINTVKMQRLKPELCLLTKHVDPATQQTVDLAIIVDRAAVDARGERYEYAEVITPTEIRTYWNGDPHAYGEAPDRYPNELGFVPILRVKNDTECRPTFSKCLPQLDSVNELASYLNNIIGRHAEPQWAVFGAEASEMVKSGNNVWFFPKDSNMEAILAEIDIAGTLEFLNEIKQETKSNLPELAFDDLRTKDQIATETLEIQLVELNAKIWKMRRRYDAGIVDAHKMAAMVALTYGIRGIETLLAPHSLDFARPVRPITKMEQVAERQAELMLEQQEQLNSGESMTRLGVAVGLPATQDADMEDSE